MIGERIGQYTVKAKLGDGGMGAVYLGEHAVMRKRAAIKVLLPQWTQNETIVRWFTNEAIAMGALDHPNIVTVSDCGQLANGCWYIVMEYLDGGTLGRFCASLGGPVSVHDTLHVLAQVAAGLEAAHRIGIVHRDLKPENIFLVQRGLNPRFAKILDWGISKLGEQHGRSATRTGMIAGTPSYMAPEQMKDLRTVDKRTDVFAMGVIAYQMVTGGWLPFQRMEQPDEFANLSLVSMYEVVMRGEPVDPRKHVPSIDPEVASAIFAAIHPDPARRPQTPRAFILLLAGAVRGDGFNASGTVIVKEVAPELLEIGNLGETVRGVKPISSRASSRYQFREKLGAGGMAEVFRATQSGAEGFSRTVAVKLVLPGFSTVPQFASMFVEEAKLASLLDHPNIVSVSDFDRDEEGRLFLVMEYVDGRDLASVAASGRLPFWATIFVITEVLRGLGYAHELPTAAGPRGVIHRDVSPHNVLLSWEGAVKVSDFGIAKARDASVATASTMIKGKPAYMSPEQASGEALDGRSDLFAVGIMMWELLTGRRLFDGSTQETLTRVIAGQVPPPSSVCADVPRDLDAITMRFLARDRDKRYPRAEAAIVDLSHCVDAPRNGRSDFAKLLADRFPAAIAQRSSRSPTTSEPARKPPVADKDQVGEPSTRRDVAPQQRTKPWAPSTTLGSAASEAVRSRRVSRRGSVLLASFAVIAGTAGLVGGYRLLRSGSGDVAKNAAIPAPTRNEARAITTDGTRDLDAATTLTIDTAPPGGSVIVDGVYRGQAPVTISANVGQRLDIEASRAGYVTETTTVPVARLAQTVVVALRAKPTPLVNAAPANPEASSVPKPAKPGKRSSAKTRQSTSGSGTFNPDDAMD